MKGYNETITLGELLDWLASLPPDNEIVFDFCQFSPGEMNSSRGDYSKLAISWLNGKTVTAQELLNRYRPMVGATFQGYKGGNYTMDRDTQVWVDEWGSWTGTAITGLDRGEHQSIIRTTKVR